MGNKVAIRESVVNYIKCMAPTFESHKVKLDKEIEKHKKGKEELGKYIKRQSVLVEISQLMLNNADISTMMDFIVGMGQGTQSRILRNNGIHA